jgi:hypothetical protein
VAAFSSVGRPQCEFRTDAANGFSNSYWTQQETGFAVGRGVKIILFKMGEDPTGFISKQALARRQHKAEEIAAEVDMYVTRRRRAHCREAYCRKEGNGAY